MAAQIVVAALDQPERVRAGRALAEDRVPCVGVLDRDLVREPALNLFLAQSGRSQLGQSSLARLLSHTASSEVPWIVRTCVCSGKVRSTNETS